MGVGGGSGGSGGVGSGGGGATTSAPGITEPTTGQAIIAGTVQHIAWSGGGTMDVVLVPSTGPEVSIAMAVSAPFDWTVPLIKHTASSYTVVVRASGLLRSLGAPEAAPAEAPDAAPAERGAVSVLVGSFAGVRLNGTAAAEYFWMDTTTGDTQVLGTVGDLRSLQANAVTADAVAHRVHVIGHSASAAGPVGSPHIYTLDAYTGALLSSPVISGAVPQTIDVTPSGILAYHWDAAMSKEIVTRLDPDSGDQTPVGTVGDLHFWSNETAVSGAHTYVLGANGTAASMAGQIYVLDAAGAFVEQHPTTVGAQPVQGLVGLVADSAGELVAFHWNGAAEDVVHIDPETGAVTVVGTVGDLRGWSGVSGLNLTNDQVYVIGEDAARLAKLYVLDAHTGALLYSTPTMTYPTGGVVVY